MANVWIATPVDGGIAGGYVQSMVNLTRYFIAKNIKHSYHQICNDSLITRARNTMVAQFLEDTTATHLLFLDSDITFHPMTVEKLLLSGYDVCGAAYPIKSANYDRVLSFVEKRVKDGKGYPTPEEMEAASTKFVINLIAEESMTEEVGANGTVVRKAVQTKHQVTSDGFAEVAEIGTGFMCIKRTALLKMIEHYPNDWYATDTPALIEMDKRTSAIGKHCFWTFFDTMLHEVSRRYLSEDYAFCQKYRKTGGKVYLLLDADIAHMGPVVFQGNLAKTLILEGRVEHNNPQAAAAVPSAEPSTDSPQPDVAKPGVSSETSALPATNPSDIPALEAI